MDYLSTSESVTSGHPDKLCDYISDSILDECLLLDPKARVAVEVFVKGLDPNISPPPSSYIIIGGEVTINSNIKINYEDIARKAATEIGYNCEEVGMDANNKDSCKVITIIGNQSLDISQGVTHGKGLFDEQGAGDQGVMYGYATVESESFDILKGTYMPLPIVLAHRLTLGITKARKDGKLSWARPDGKSQVTVAFNEDGSPSHIDSIIIAIQHDDLVKQGLVENEEYERELIINGIDQEIIQRYMPNELLNGNLKLIINGTGRFIIGGPQGDAGLTGRKIIVDTYGGIGRHGGGAFSGKDPSKVDRSGAYMARWVAKHIVASGLAKQCEIQVSYAIGVAEPVNITVNVNTFNTSNLPNDRLKEIIKNNFDFRPSSIIDKLNLNKPIYAITSSGGHFGRYSYGDYFTWEKINDEIIQALLQEV